MWNADGEEGCLSGLWGRVRSKAASWLQRRLGEAEEPTRDDYLYPDVDFHNVSGLPPLALPPPACAPSRGLDCSFLIKQVTCCRDHNIQVC